MFSKILIANRGEIACRIIRTARMMGIRTVAVYSDADARARHVRMADEAVHIGASPSRDSYLRGEAIIEAARQTGAEAIHPGYGFLSENEAFAAACADAGITFIGPSAQAIAAMGLKDRAKQIMQEAGVPIVPGYQGERQQPDYLKVQADKIGYPVLIKAVAGGGGKGMRRVDAAAGFLEALESCQREAQAAFGNPRVLIEKYITRPRHIEVQVFGDNYGNAVYLFERDCSLQRRHQKVVEEAPAPGLSPAIRRAMGEAAVKAVKAIQYSGAGTLEFIFDTGSGDFYFMEMNTRLQVEHPVTEMITGQDLVSWQIRVAAGEKLPRTQDQLAITGHAFEVRLYAEDPANDFLPQTGRVTSFRVPPSDSSIRIDTGIDEGDEISIYYDPMIAKLIARGKDRESALRRMRYALTETGVAGVVTNQEFLRNIFDHPAFQAGDVDTGFIERHGDTLLPEQYGLPEDDDLRHAACFVAMPQQCETAVSEPVDPWQISDNWRMNGTFSRHVRFTCRGETYGVTVTGEDRPSCHAAVVRQGRDVTVFRDGRVIHLHIPDPASEGTQVEAEGQMAAPMPGKIVRVMAAQGDSVRKDQPLLILEAMKMEMTIRAACDGVIEILPVAEGAQVEHGALLVSIGKPA